MQVEGIGPSRTGKSKKRKENTAHSSRNGNTSNKNTGGSNKNTGGGSSAAREKLYQAKAKQVEGIGPSRTSKPVSGTNNQPDYIKASGGVDYTKNNPEFTKVYKEYLSGKIEKYGGYEAYDKGMKALYGNYKKTVEGLTYGADNSASKAFLQESEALRDFNKTLINYFSIYKDGGAPDGVDVDSILNGLKEDEGLLSGGYDEIREREKYYGQWKDADEYKAWDAANKEHQRLMTLDTEKEEAAVKKLEGLWSSVARLGPGTSAWLPGDIAAQRGKEMDSLLREAGYDSVEALDAEIKRRKNDIRLSRAEKQAYAKETFENDAKSAADFDYYVRRGKALADAEKERENDRRGSPLAEAMVSNGYGPGMTMTTFSDIEAQYAGNPTEEERQVFYYYNAKHEEGLISDEEFKRYTDAYLDAMDKRGAEKMYNKVLKDKPALEYLYGAHAGLSQHFEGLGAWFDKDGYVEPGQTAYTSGLVRENLKENNGGAGQVVYDLITTTANMVPSIATGYLAGAATGSQLVGRIASGLSIGASAGGQGYADMINEGYTEKQAKAYGMVTGALETALESVLNGIGALGEGALTKLTGRAMKDAAEGIQNAALRWAVKTGARYASESFSEGLEEGLQDILSPFVKWLFTGDYDGVDWGEAAYSAFLGALTAVPFNASTGAINAEVSKQQVIGMIESGNIDALMELGDAFDKDTYTGQLLSRVDFGKEGFSKKDVRNMGKALRVSQTEADAVIRRQVERAVAAEGVKGEAAKTLTDIAVRYVNGETVTGSDREAVRGLNIGTEGKSAERVLDRVLNKVSDVRGNVANTVNAYTRARTGQDAGYGKDFAVESVYEDVREALTGFNEKTLSGRVDTENGVHPRKIASIENGKMRLELTDGRTVDAQDVKYADPNIAMLYEGVRMMGLDAQTSNYLINIALIGNARGNNGNTGMGWQVRDIQRAYRAGQYGNEKAAPDVLSRTQWDAVYAKGAEVAEQNKRNKAAASDIRAREAAGEELPDATKKAADIAEERVNNYERGKERYVKQQAAEAAYLDEADRTVERRRENRRREEARRVEDIRKRAAARNAAYEDTAKNKRNKIRWDLDEQRAFLRENEADIASLEAKENLSDEGKKTLRKLRDEQTKLKNRIEILEKRQQREEARAGKQKDAVTKGTKKETGTVSEAVDAGKWKTEPVPVKTATVKSGGRTVTFKYIGVDISKISDSRQRARVTQSMAVVRMIASKITHTDVVFYASEVKNGRRVLTVDLPGKKAGSIAPNGIYYNGTLYLDINAGQNGEGGILFAAAHELTHFMRDQAGDNYDSLRDFIRKQFPDEDIDALIDKEIFKAADKGLKLSRDKAEEEVVARFMERMFTETDAVERMAALKAHDEGLWQKIKSWFEEKLKAIRGLYEGIKPYGDEAVLFDQMQDRFDELAELFAEGVVEAGENYEASISKDRVRPTTDASAEASFSRRLDSKMMDDVETFLKDQGISWPESLLTTVRTQREMVRKWLHNAEYDAATGKRKLLLPEDIDGKGWVSNGSYGRSMEPTTECVRSIGYDALCDMIAKKIGRPLKMREALAISQNIGLLTNEIQCLYCYVAADRMAYREAVATFIEDRNRAVEALRSGKISTVKEFETEYLRKRKSTKQTEKIAQYYFDAVKNGKKLLDPAFVADLSNDVEKIAEIKALAEKAGYSTEEITLMSKYAQSASWAKKRTKYRAYTGDILNWSDDVIKKLNREFGLRFYSFADFSPAFILENMQEITDAAARGLKGLAYTKDLDFVRIFAPSKININVSIFGNMVNGVMQEDAMQGANWSEARKLRDQYGNVGLVFVATNDDAVRWALDQDWIDVVIPYHTVRSGEKMTEFFSWKDFKSSQEDKIVGSKSKEDRKGLSKAIYPQQHNNDFDTYMKALEKNKLSPRFPEYIDNPNYMKLVNETRLSAKDTPAMQPVFNMDAVLDSITKMEQSGGYYKPLGGSVNAMEVFARMMAKGIEETDTVGLKDLRLDTAAFGKELAELQEEMEEANAQPKFSDSSTGEDVKFSIREEDPPKKTRIAYKVFFVKDGKLYPPMVANPGGADTPVGVWLNADIGTQAPDSKTGRKQVKAGGKGTQGGSGSLAFRPGWHLGEIPLATQFDRLNPETGKKELFPENFVWAECEIAADIDYQEEAMSYGYTKNGKFQHSLAGLPRLPVDGYYIYRTNPNPDTVPWLITGAMKVNRLLSDAEVNWILHKNGIPPKQRVGGNKTLRDLGLVNRAFPDRDYSYNELISREGIKITDVSKANEKTSAGVRKKAQENAEEFGIIRSDGSILVHISDTNTDVIIGRPGIYHGLGRRLDINGKYAEHAAEILQNSILINENYARNNNADVGLVYIGAARDSNGVVHIVHSEVNRFTNEVTSMDVLYSMNGSDEKTTGANNPPQVSTPAPRSTLTIAEVLDLVKDHFPDLLSMDVLKHYGFNGRPKGNSGIGRSVLFSDREDVPDARTLLSNALTSAAANDIERTRLQDYQDKIGAMNAEQEKLNDLNSQIKELSFAKGKRDTDRLRKLKEEKVKTQNRINIYDKQLLKLEASEPLSNVLRYETEKAVDRERQKARERLSNEKRAAAERLDRKVRETRDQTRQAEQKKAEERKKKQIESLIEEERQRSLKFEMDMIRAAGEEYNKLERAKKRSDRKIENLQKQLKNAKESRQKGIDQRHSTDLRTKIKNIRDDFQNRLLEGNEHTYIPKPLVRGVIAVCAAIDPTGENQDTKAAQKYRTGLEALSALRSAYDGLKKSNDSDLSTEFQQEFSDRIGDLADAIGNKPLRDMNRNELEDVYNVLSDIRHMLMNAKKQIGTQKAITNYKTAKNIVNNMFDVKRLKLTTWKLSSIFRNWFTNPMRAVREMSGYDKDSELMRLFDDLMDGVRKGDMFRMTASQRLQNIITGRAGEKALRDAAQKKIDFGLEDVDGNKLLMTKMQAMQLLLTYERETSNENRMHLSANIYIPDADLIAKGKYAESLKAAQKLPAISMDTINSLSNGMNEWDRAFMDAARDVYRMSADAMNETSMVLIGRPIATEKNYIGYEVNQDFVAKESENVEFNAAVANMGMAKSVVPNSRKPVIMRGLNIVLEKHIDDVAKYHGLAVPVRNWNKAINTIMTVADGGTPVKEAIRDVWGNDGLKLLDQAVADLQGNRRNDTIPVLSKLKGNFVQATLASNISVWLKQGASYPTAGAVLSPAALIKGLSYLGSDITRSRREALWAEIDRHTATHYNRRIGMSTEELAEYSKSRGLMKRINGRMGHFSPMMWIQSMDVRTTAALWVAAKAQVKSDITGTDIKVGSEEYWDKVTDLYNRVIEETQPMYDPLHRAEIMKNKAQNFIMFQTQPLQNSGILREATMELRAAKKRYGLRSGEAKTATGKFLKATTSQLASHAVFAAMTLAAAALTHRMDKYRDDEENVLTKDSVGKQYLIDVGEAIFGAVVPVFGNYIISALEYLTGESKYDVLSDPVVDMINTTINRLSNLKNPTKDHIISAVTDIAGYLGIPAGNAKKIIDGIRLHYEDIKNGEFLTFDAGVNLDSTQIRKRLYDAIIAGDNEEITLLRDQYKSDEAYHQDIRSMLKEYDDRIIQALQAREDGRSVDYYAIINDIVSSGFEKDDVLKALKSASSVEGQLRLYGYGGGVDLLKRPQVSSDEMKRAGWYEVEPGSYATVYTSTYSNESGNRAVNVTPIVADEDGNLVKILSSEELEKYANDLLAGKKDKLGIQIGAIFEGEDAITEADAAAETIHTLQEKYYEDDDDTEETDNTDGYGSGYDDAMFAVTGGDAHDVRAVYDDLVDGGKTEKKAGETVRKAVKSAYVDGDIDRDTAAGYVREYSDKSDNDIYWLMEEWDYAKEHEGKSTGYSKYGAFIKAVETGTNLRSEADRYLSHGVKKETLASEITSHYKPIYRDMTNAERASLKGYLLNAYTYLGYNRNDRSKAIDKWLED